MVIHVVTPGDTLYSIALNYDVSAESIIINNGLEANQPLVVGQALLILLPRTDYTVQAGDTLQSIAAAFGTNVSALLQNNLSLNGRQDIQIGEKLIINYYTQPLGSIYLNGYAYPFIQDEELYRTLPFLSCISVFTYGIGEDGSLIPADDSKILSESQNYGARPIMVISTLSASGSFSNELAALILNNPGLRSILIENIVSEMKEKGYYGLDVDFEYVLPSDRDAFISFNEALANALHQEGLQLFISLAPKTSAQQKGLLYESHDYRALGETADRALIMSYEWGYKYGPPMAVAPINKVRQVLEYALTEIPAEKIFLGMPNYAYDWELPYIRNVTVAENISNLRAVQIAAEKRAEIEFDNLSKTPYFYYRDSSMNPHVVWFEDPRSYKAKASLVHEYGISGINIWNTLRFFPQGLLTISSMYDLNKF